MTRDVNITVSGTMHLIGQNDSEVITSQCVGTFFDKNGFSYLIYEENLEGVDEPVSNLVRFDSRYVEVTRKGQINVRMIFDETVDTTTSYVTMYGTFKLHIITNSLVVLRDEDSIQISVKYKLGMDDLAMSDSQLLIKVTSIK